MKKQEEPLHDIQSEGNESTSEITEEEFFGEPSGEFTGPIFKQDMARIGKSEAVKKSKNIDDLDQFQAQPVVTEFILEQLPTEALDTQAEEEQPEEEIKVALEDAEAIEDQIQNINALSKQMTLGKPLKKQFTIGVAPSLGRKRGDTL